MSAQYLNAMKSSYLQDAFSNFIDYPILSEDTLRTANSLHMEFTSIMNANTSSIFTIILYLGMKQTEVSKQRQFQNGLT